MMNRPNVNVSQSSKIFIGNLPIDQSEAQLEQTLYELFSAFGEIVDLFLVRNKETGRHRGFGFICFTTAEAAQNAVALNDKRVFENYTKALKVDPARERRLEPMHQTPQTPAHPASHMPQQPHYAAPPTHSHRGHAPGQPPYQGPGQHPQYNPNHQPQYNPNQQPQHNHNAPAYRAPQQHNTPWVQQPYWETSEQ